MFSSFYKIMSVFLLNGEQNNVRAEVFERIHMVTEVPCHVEQVTTEREFRVLLPETSLRPCRKTMRGRTAG